MTLFRHLVATDVRQFSAWIAAWIVLVIVAAVLAGLSPLVESERPDDPLITAAWLVTAARWLVAATLVASIVQAHPLVGSTAFWMTRPIPPPLLMRAKLALVAALLVVVPAAADTVLMLAYHVPPAQIARVLVDSTLFRAAAATFLVGAAAFTPSLSRFALLCGAAICATAVGITIALWVWTWPMWHAEWGVGFVSLSSQSILSTGTGTPDATADILALLVFLAGGVLLLRAQYRRRPLRRTIALGLTVPLLALAVAEVWPWSVLTADVAPPPWAVRGDVSLATGPGEVRIERVDFVDEGTASVFVARTHAWLRNLPPGWIAVSRLLEGGLTLADGTRLPSSPATPGAMLPAGEAEEGAAHRVLLDTLGVDAVGGFNMPRAERAALLAFPESELPTLPATGRYRGEFQVELLQLNIAATTSLREGAGIVFQDGPLRMVVDRILRNERGGLLGIVLEARISDARSAVERHARPEFTVFLRNARTREAVAAEFPAIGGDLPLMMSGEGGWHVYMPSSGGFSARRQRLRFRTAYQDIPLPPGPDPQPARVTVDESWGRDAELVIVRTRRGGRLRRTLDIQELRLAR